MLLQLPEISWGTILTIGGVLSTIGLVMVAFTALRAWTFAKWWRAEVRAEVADAQGTQEYAKKLNELLAPEITKVAEYCVRAHNVAPDAHAQYVRMQDAFVRAHVAEELTKHDESPTAHHAVLDRYPDRREMQGAIARLEEKIDANTRLILAEVKASRTTREG